MIRFLALALVAVYGTNVQGLPRPADGESSGRTSSAKQINPNARPLIYVPPSERQQYLHQYDFPLLDPQFYNYDKPLLPRVQPQIVLYGPGGPGQPFLLQPGAPPGNFLVPQPHPQGPDPNVILRDSPQRPFFLAGYPKPAHIPPIEKDAEEIPTNPSKIPPIVNSRTPNTQGRKPVKLETFNEKDEGNTERRPTEADALAAADRNPYFHTRTSDLHPGQRFFILNGQPLFPNYPNYQTYPQFQNPNVVKYAQNSPSVEDFLVRNPVTGQIDDISPEGRENVVLLNQPEDFRNQQLFRANLPLELANPLTKDSIRVESNGEDGLNLDQIYKFQTSDDDSDAVVIDARERDESESTTENASDDSEGAQRPEKIPEPTISQAQPAAIALAGPGGVAAAAPRGTAFVGKQGVAISSPQATAVAGPSKENKKKDKKETRKN